MADQLLVNGVTELLKKLTSVVSQQISEVWGAHDDLEKLKGTFEMIAAVTTDAEAQQEKSAVVQLWLKRLNDVVYDADDVLDELSYEAMRQLEIGGKKNKVLQLFSSYTSVASNCKMSWKMGRKIKHINTRLDDISVEMKKYHFISTPYVNTYDHNTVQQNRLISSLVNESSVLGRDHDKSSIVKMLTAVQESSASSSSKFSVLSIVGMGGLGKTTLARLVYEDASVKSSFDKTGWVCVSDDFNIQKILINIIESCTNSKCDSFSNVSVLVDKIQAQLSNEKYLLVLDDLWNEDAEEWYILQDLLSVGAEGSRVLVTTRSKKVASVVGGAVQPYMLKNLPPSVCWSIIKTRAFSPGGASETPSMTCIGEKIAEICGGSPLAAKVLGNVLRLHKSENDWRSILDHSSLKTLDVKKKIIPILKLSYDKLPSPLKLCFSYCSVFPKDWVINKKVLVRLWMAEGFLNLSHGASQISPEDVGDDYFHSLLANSFFQDVELDRFGDIETCKMHDLVHDLAQSVSSVHDIKIINSREMDSFSNHRRLSLKLDLNSKVLKKSKRLRSILFLIKYDLGEHLLHGKNLRVVSLLEDLRYLLYANTHPSRVVHSLVFKHRHLRYLDLSYCSFGEGQDVSINQLYNLQTLVLCGCKNVEMIIGGIGSLKNLRHLNLSYSDVKQFDDSIVQLTNLQTLDLSHSRELVALPENIGALKDLTKLNFTYCRSLKVLPKEVGKLTRLRSLDLSDTDIEVLPESCINNFRNLEVLCSGECKLPKEIKNLSKLRIFKFSEWNNYDMPRGVETLTSLEVLKSYVITTGGSRIDELANLNSLRDLKILNLRFVRGGIDAERAKLKDKTNLRDLSLWWGFGDDEMEFDEVLESLEPNPCLRRLEVCQFPGLKLPKWMGSSSCLPNLVEIKICYPCNRCQKLPALGLLPCLRVLSIENMKSVKCLGEEFYCQLEEEEERIVGYGSGGAVNTTVSLFPSLISLKVASMENLEEWVTPPAIYNSFPSLEKLEIWDSPKLRSTPKSFSFLKKLELYSITTKTVTSIFTTGGLTSLTSVRIHFYKNLYIPLGVLLQNITPNLQDLHIYKCTKLQGFVEDDDLNNYNNKEGDDDEGEAVLSFSCPATNSNSNNTSNSLRSLELMFCPVFTLLPDLRSFTSLRNLDIYHCDKLKESISYDLKTLTFLEYLKFDFIQSEYEHPQDPADKSLRIANW